MNYKKGLLRLFIVTSILSALGGTYYLSSDSSSGTAFRIETIFEIKKNLNEPACAAIVKQNPVEFPAMNPSFACSPLSIYWKSIKEFQAKNPSKYPTFNGELVSDAQWEQIREYQKEMLMYGLLVGFLWNLFIWILLLSAYFIFHWVKKGFKA